MANQRQAESKWQRAKDERTERPLANKENAQAAVTWGNKNLEAKRRKREKEGNKW
jgi:hypothetical protein